MAKGTPPPVQPNFDNRIRTWSPLSINTGGIGGSIPPKNSQATQGTRGYMVQQFVMPGYSAPAYFNFLYNPSTIEATYDIQSGGAAAAMMFPNAMQTADLAVPLNQSASWTLLFDRTYELWDAAGYKSQAGNFSSISAVQDPTISGVYADVYQLMWFTGIFQSLAGTSNAQLAQSYLGNVTPGQNSVLSFNSGVMMMVPALVYFGGYSQNGASPSYIDLGVNYSGYVSQWDVTFTHWQQAMIPMRCSIDITFQLLPLSPGGNGYYNNAGAVPKNKNSPGGIVRSTTGTGSSNPTESRF